VEEREPSARLYLLPSETSIQISTRGDLQPAVSLLDDIIILVHPIPVFPSRQMEQRRQCGGKAKVNIYKGTPTGPQNRRVTGRRLRHDTATRTRRRNIRAETGIGLAGSNLDQNPPLSAQHITRTKAGSQKRARPKRKRFRGFCSSGSLESSPPLSAVFE